MTQKEIEDRINYLSDVMLFGELRPEEQKEFATLTKQLEEMISLEQLEIARIKESQSKIRKNARSRGRYGEKKVAKEVGGKRKGGVGMEDVRQGLFSYEVKTVAKIPASVTKGLEQARRLGGSKIPVLVFRCNRNTIYCVDGSDWVGLHGKWRWNND